MKKTVEAIIAIEMIQKEMATGSFGFKNPCKSCVMLYLQERNGSYTDYVKCSLHTYSRNKTDNN